MLSLSIQSHESISRCVWFVRGVSVARETKKLLFWIAMRRTQVRLGLGSTLSEELRKLGPFLQYHINNSYANRFGNFMFGTDNIQEPSPQQDASSSTQSGASSTAGKESEAVRDARAKHREMYEALQEKQRLAAEAAFGKELEGKTFFDRMRLYAKRAWKDLQNELSQKSGVLRLVQQCTTSHMAEVAVQRGIDVKNVNIVLEKGTIVNGIAKNDTIVGYIEAPQATDEEVLVFAEKLQQACPAARAMGEKIEWRRMPPR